MYNNNFEVAKSLRIMRNISILALFFLFGVFFYFGYYPILFSAKVYLLITSLIFSLILLIQNKSEENNKILETKSKNIIGKLISLVFKTEKTTRDIHYKIIKINGSKYYKFSDGSLIEAAILD